MSQPPKPGTRTEPSATRLSTGRARNSQDAITFQNPSSLHIPTSRLTSRTPSPTPGPREHTRGPQASAISSSASVDGAAPCVRTQSQAHAVQASTILADALEKLDELERDTLRAQLSSSTFKIDDAIREAYDKAKELQARGALKRWSWTYRGRQVYVQEQADKVVRFLDKFKSVGDTVAGIDPVHAGLPWVGVRSILELAISDSNLRGAIATGIEVTLFASHRLAVYSDMHAQLPISSASENLRGVLVNLSARVLKFLAQAIDIEPRSTVSRIARHSWGSDSIQEFEKECDNLCGKAEQEASICGREMDAQWKGRLEDSLKSLKGIHSLTTSLSRVHDKLDLAKLTCAKDATYDSDADSKLVTCLPGTRAELLNNIDKWATDVGGERIFWLCGKAGTGKSTIARTVAQKLDDEGLLGASFFFKRGHANRSHARLVFPTIARQLADKYYEVARLIAAALDRDSFVCNKPLKAQFEQLLSLPLKHANQLLTPSAGIVLVIDALDECESGADIKTILSLLSRIEEIVSVRLRIFVTSRPELPIEPGFRDMTGSLHHDVRLEKAQQTTIAGDIRAFYVNEFGKIREDSMSRDDELPVDWPGDDSVDILVQRAVPLFIFAFTICLFLKDDPRNRLHVILGQSSENALDGLRDTYLPILREALIRDGNSQRQTRVREFKEIVGSIVLLYDPLSASALEALLGIDGGVIGRTLRPLDAVLNIPRTTAGRIMRDKSITLFHLLFRDFLVNPSEQNHHQMHENDIRIDAKATHKALGEHCIRLLSGGRLKEDICDVAQPGTRRADMERARLHASLPEAVRYACSFWVQHLTASGGRIHDDGPVHQFLKKHLLHWMEALSWLGRAGDAIHNVNALRSIVDNDEGKEISSLLDDARRFALSNRYIIDEAPLQTYVSALLFAPSKSNVRQMFGGGLQRHFIVMPGVTERWGAERQKLEGHDEYVSAVAFSPDGKTVASGSWDKTARLWDAATGEERQVFEGHDEYVSTVAFSPDGKMVASGSWDKTVRLWDAATGEERQVLEGHDSEVRAVAFSPDGKTVASGSRDRTVRLWDAATGEETQVLVTSRRVHSVAFSDDGSSLETNIGRLDLNTEPLNYRALITKPQPALLLEESWIKRDNADFVLLPHEYRGNVNDVYGSRLVIGQMSGAISLFSFK